MKREQLERYFNQIKELTKGDNSSNSNIIDYKNGKSISIEAVETMYYKYLDLECEIDNYIEINDLDNINDRDKIIEYFKSDVDKDYFEYNQAVLKPFVEFMCTYIKNEA